MKQRYKVLLLDADGTLFDFLSSEREAYGKTARLHNLPEGDEAYRLYSSINEELWQMLARGEISKSDLVVRRFERLLQRLELEGDGKAVSDSYRRYLGEGAALLPGAQELCQSLADHCRLIIASNGVTEIQVNRLARSAIAPYIEALVVSESGGADKPDLGFFTYLDEQVGPLDKSQVLMVGDRLETDIVGGARFGVDTCWFNPNSLPLSGETAPTYTINELSQLMSIVFP